MGFLGKLLGAAAAVTAVAVGTKAIKKANDKKKKAQTAKDNLTKARIKQAKMRSLQALSEAYKNGAITEVEFETEKQKLLGKKRKKTPSIIKEGEVFCDGNNNHVCMNGVGITIYSDGSIPFSPRDYNIPNNSKVVIKKGVVTINGKIAIKKRR